MEPLMPKLFGETVLRATDMNGAPVSGALCFVYEAGTTTPVTTYSDNALTTAQPHPVVANSSGVFAPIYVPGGEYKANITTAAGASLPGFPVDNLGYSGAWDRGLVANIFDWDGLAANGDDDDLAIFQTAFNSGDPLYIPPGYRFALDGKLTLPQVGFHIFSNDTTNNTDSNAVGGAPKLLFTGSGTGCFENANMASSIRHFGFANIAVIASGAYDWIWNLAEPIGMVFDGVKARNTGGGGVFKSRKTASANPSWVNRLNLCNFTVPDATAQYVIDTDMSDSWLIGNYVTGGMGTISRGTGGNKFTGNHFDRTNSETNAAGLTIKVETASGKQTSVVGNYLDLHSNYGIVVDADDASTEQWVHVSIGDNTFRNPTATADIRLKRATGEVRGTVIQGNAFTIAQVAPVEVDSPWRHEAIGPNGTGSIAPTAYDPDAVRAFIEIHGTNITGLLSAKASKTMRGLAGVSGMFGTTPAADTDNPLLLGSITATRPFIAAGRRGDGTTSDLALMTDNAIRALLTAAGNLSLNVGLLLPGYTTAQIEDATHAANTGAAKVAGQMIRNSTTGRILQAMGNADTSVWADMNGTTVHTPS
jgi:hypothetical protein